MGRYWYECRDGQMVPKGCLTDDNAQVNVDDTYNTKDAQMKCVLGSDGFLTIVYKACFSQGGARDVGSQWDDGTAFYTCVREGSNVRTIMLGCVDQGRPLKLDERVAKSEFIYQCKRSTDGTPKLNKVGCVYEGRKYNIGESIEAAEFWYTCTSSGVTVVGCMYESHRLQDGDRYTKGDIMYACRVTIGSAKVEPFACLARSDSGDAIERKVGCFWVEGDFEYTCKSVSADKVVKTKTQCFYSSQQGKFKVAPGCVQVAQTVAVGCLDLGSNDLKMETYPADQVGNLPGLRRC